MRAINNNFSHDLFKEIYFTIVNNLYKSIKHVSFYVILDLRKIYKFYLIINICMMRILIFLKIDSCVYEIFIDEKYFNISKQPY